MNRNIEVFDIETLKSCITYTGINIDTGICSQFVLHKDRFELKELIDHLRSLKGGIGYNNLGFDYPVLHNILVNHIDWINLDKEVIIQLIYDKSQDIINNSEPLANYIAPKYHYFKQLDLFKIWHFNNKAKATSLKALEIAMNLPNVLDMPIEHTKSDITIDEVKDILDYNKNDVEATLEFYKRSTAQIELRKQLTSIYNIDLMNTSDVGIGEKIFLDLLAKEMEVNKWELKDLRTKRDKVVLNDIILPYIRFNTKPFKALLDKFKDTIVQETKNGFKMNLIASGLKYYYGQGGIHACTKAGVYEDSEDFGILDIDVASFYPNIAVNNKFRPEHLGEGFTKIYSNIYNERSKIPKSDPRNGAYKLMLNGCFGKAGDENSFLFDNEFLLSITVNGQLLLTMLLEKLLEIKDIQILQANTDGITIKYNAYDYELIKKICADWEELTKLKLEYCTYKKMIIRDVNNYIAVKPDGKVKYKGAFEIDKEYHKDNSFRIIPLALSEYFVKGIPVEETIKNHQNIYDFCGRQKFTKDSYGETHKLEYDKDNLPYNKIEKQQKNVRYFISTDGNTFIKQYKKGSSEVINKGYKVTIFNKYYELPINDYNINHTFYIKECYKEIDNIIDKQLELF